MTPQSAILDLTYRNYDGPLDRVNQRWVVIARTMILKAFSLKSLWVLTLLSGWYFLVMITILFFMQELSNSSPQGQQALQGFIGAIIWKDQFFHGFGYSQHLLLVVALVVGAGSIANDNRANALLVYLSKPCTKVDYLIGKWLGIFVPLLVVLAIPTTIFYLYGLFSFREQGFLTGDPWLFLRLLAVLPLAAAVHASLVLLVSSFFKQGIIAGAVYAGIYFMGYFFSLLMSLVFRFGHGHTSAIVVDLNYCSIDSIVIGISRAIIHPTPSMPFGMPSRGAPAFPPAPILPYLGLIIGIVVFCMWATWTRIRAVEVV